MQPVPLSQFEIDINKYEFVKYINHGTYGSVNLVTEKGTNKSFAAKIIFLNKYYKESKDVKETVKKTIDNEIRIMMTSNHPTIIKFRGYSLKGFKNQDNPVILMEYAPNGSLQELLDNAFKGSSPIDFSNTTKQILLIGIARGMKYLHKHYICHCDLKPGNILKLKYLMFANSRFYYIL